MIDNLDYEKKLLNLLGYTLSNPNKSNRWIILDNDNNQVGFIQYKKIYKGNKKKGYPATYAYITEIDSKDILFSNTRKVYDNDINKIDDIYYSYIFDIKRENGDIDHVDLEISDEINLNMCIWSKAYGFSIFKIDYTGLHIFFGSKTDNFNIEEVISYRKTSDYLASYSYQISYCKKGLKISDNIHTTTREISGYSNGFEKLKIFEKTWVNNKLKTNKEHDVLGTVDEMIILQEMGIDAFNHYRYLLNKILPFKRDIIDELVTPELIDEYHLELFIPKEENKIKTM